MPFFLFFIPGYAPSQTVIGLGQTTFGEFYSKLGSSLPNRSLPKDVEGSENMYKSSSIPTFAFSLPQEAKLKKYTSHVLYLPKISCSFKS